MLRTLAYIVHTNRFQHGIFIYIHIYYIYPFYVLIIFSTLYNFFALLPLYIIPLFVSNITMPTTFYFPVSLLVLMSFLRIFNRVWWKFFFFFLQERVHLKNVYNTEKNSGSAPIVLGKGKVSWVPPTSVIEADRPSLWRLYLGNGNHCGFKWALFSFLFCFVFASQNWWSRLPFNLLLQISFPSSPVFLELWGYLHISFITHFFSLILLLMSPWCYFRIMPMKLF